MNRRALALGGLATSLLAVTSGAAPVTPAPTRDPLWFVDPELRPAARQLQEMSRSMPAFSDESLATERKAMDAWAKPQLAAPSVARRKIPGRGGAPEVTVYVINAKAGAKRPGILHTHGGGYFLGTAAGDIRDLQEIAAALDCAIVTVDYRLAPETRYSGAVEDNYAGLLWLHAHAGELGVDPARIAVMGESAGGGHAALLAIAARDRGEVPLAFQCLIYPMLDDRTGSARQAPPNVGTLGWDAPANRYGWRSFLGREPGGADVPAAAVPARTADLAGLPPAFIGVGSIDLFVEEDIDYARRLIGAGVTTELLVVPGAFHGFDLIAPDAALSKSFKAAKLGALRRALAA